MDTSPDVLAETVRAKRIAIDNDLEVLRVRLQKLRKMDPRRIDGASWTMVAVAIAAGAGVLWYWARQRPVSSLHRLFLHALAELYSTEQELVHALRRMADRASHPELKQALEQHLHATAGHVERLERVFRSIGKTPRGARSSAVALAMREADRLLKRGGAAEVRDAWLIGSAQRLEHIEIANYGTARTFAETLGHTHAAQLLQETLDEERVADEKLTRLAERFVNPQSLRPVRRA